MKRLDLLDITQFDLLDAFKFNRTVHFVAGSFKIAEIRRTSHKNEFKLKLIKKKDTYQIWYIFLQYEFKLHLNVLTRTSRVSNSNEDKSS